jgi:hypothetical protein
MANNLVSHDRVIPISVVPDIPPYTRSENWGVFLLSQDRIVGSCDLHAVIMDMLDDYSKGNNVEEQRTRMKDFRDFAHALRRTADALEANCESQHVVEDTIADKK